MASRRLSPIDAAFAERRSIDHALQEAVATALRDHRRAGRPVAVWRDGKVIEIEGAGIERALAGAGQMETLRLSVAEWTDRDHWRWVLEDAKGTFLADHTVALDTKHPEYAALDDLEAYVDRYAAPHRRLADEQRLIDDVGAWLGRQVLGPIADRIADVGVPVAVRVLVPKSARRLLYVPLELAHARGRPLTLQQVSLVLEVVGEGRRQKKLPVDGRVRMLAIFSSPTDATPLALRRERHALKRLIERIVQTTNRAIDLRVVQYGATREALRRVLEEPWDIVHFSGHGNAARVYLEQPDGSHDEVESLDLVELLEPARGRLKLVTLSACLSAAPVAETLRELGLDQAAAKADAAPNSTNVVASEPPSGVAWELARALDCAVLAMRYPVVDDFAIALGGELYERLLGSGQPLARALQLSLRSLLREEPTPARPPLSLTTPALVGRRALDLAIDAPLVGERQFKIASAGLIGFPREPERFVGRVGALARARQTLAVEGRWRGVLFHGMAGAGKTTCALELAYGYETGRFAGFVWYKAPDDRRHLDDEVDIAGALLDLALAMEQQLPGFSMAHLVGRADELRAWLPRLTQFLRTNSILIVLDNLESLLTPAGVWRDERWAWLVEALVGHDGLSRVVLTSRVRPAGLDPASVLIETVHALPLAEAALLARELPNLSRLLAGTGPLAAAEGRRLLVDTLATVQGHPKLLELADAQAKDPATLRLRLAAARRDLGVDDRSIGTFLAGDTTTREPADFLAALEGWARSVLATLPLAAQTLFPLLCCMEEADREEWIVAGVWPRLWKELEKAGDPPALEEAVAALVAAALVEARVDPDGRATHLVHPGVAELGRREAPDGFRDVVDSYLASVWCQVFDLGFRSHAGDGGLVLRAGRAAIPYLSRRQDWLLLARLLDKAFGVDLSPALAQAATSVLERASHALKQSPSAGSREVDAVLAKALYHSGRLDEAILLARDVADQLRQTGDASAASVVLGTLVNALRRGGRAGEALACVDEMEELTRRAGHGPWTQLADRGYRLRILSELGRPDQVLAEVEELRAQMDMLADQTDNEKVAPWNVREVVLGIGRNAAMYAGDAERALALNAEVVASLRIRDAPQLSVAQTLFNDYAPLLDLGRIDQARQLLAQCRRASEQAEDLDLLASVFSALAQVERTAGDPAMAVTLGETALRYGYLVADIESRVIMHHNYGSYLLAAKHEPRLAVAHLTAALVIATRTGSRHTASYAETLAALLAAVPDAAPSSFADLCKIVESVEGVRFRELFERLAGRAADGDAELGEVLEMARNLVSGEKAGEDAR